MEFDIIYIDEGFPKGIILHATDDPGDLEKVKDDYRKHGFHGTFKIESRK
jgi:hypothetical protein